MGKLIASIVAGAVLAIAGLLMFRGAENRNVQDPLPPQPRHPVTAEMRARAEKAAKNAPENLVLQDADQKKTTLTEIADGKPVFVYFIKEGCPCSLDAEPLFQKLYAHLNETDELKVPFVGIIGSDTGVAKAWVEKHQPAYPVLAAPDQKIMAAYKAERSVYCLLLGKDGKVIKQWPGYSKGILRDINVLASQTAGIPPKPFDSAYAPKEDTSGCSFDPVIAKEEDAKLNLP